MADLIEKSPILSKLTMCINQSEGDWDDGYNTGIAEAMHYVKNAPAVNRWIPSSERLPGRFDSVLLAILSKNGYGEPAYYVTIGGMKNGTEFESYTGEICECEKVTHWMPLPEPPEKE